MNESQIWNEVDEATCPCESGAILSAHWKSKTLSRQCIPGRSETCRPVLLSSLSLGRRRWAHPLLWGETEY